MSNLHAKGERRATDGRAPRQRQGGQGTTASGARWCKGARPAHMQNQHGRRAGGEGSFHQSPRSSSHLSEVRLKKKRKEKKKGDGRIFRVRALTQFYDDFIRNQDDNRGYWEAREWCGRAGGEKVQGTLSDAGQCTPTCAAAAAASGAGAAVPAPRGRGQNKAS